MRWNRISGSDWLFVEWGWWKAHQSRLPPLQPLYVGWLAVDLYPTWALSPATLFSSLIKIRLVFLSILPGARFSKVSKVPKVLVSSKRRRLEARNFAVILIFIPPFTTYEKTSFTEQAGRSFTHGFSGRSRNGPLYSNSRYVKFKHTTSV